MVIELEVRKDGHFWSEKKEGAIRLVRLAHHELPQARAGVGTEIVELPTDEKGGVVSAVYQHASDHGRGGGLAMRAAHRDAPSRIHYPSQGLSPPDDRDGPAASLLQLDVVSRDGGRDDHHVGIADVRGPVPDGDRDTGLFQKGHIARGLEIRPRHPVAAVMEDKGDATHAGAAHADEMQALHAGGHGYGAGVCGDEIIHRFIRSSGRAILL